MAWQHLVRVGAVAQIGWFAAADARRYPRGTRVVVRTPRGLELGEVLAPQADQGPPQVEPSGTLLRAMTVEDELLAARLEKNRHQAFEACAAEMARRQLPCLLMDVEQLFDGESLLFYFLGELPEGPAADQLEQLTAQLAETYESKAGLRTFAETLAAGCGPGCGTEAAAGQGCSSCGTGCAVAGACRTSH